MDDRLYETFVPHAETWAEYLASLEKKEYLPLARSFAGEG